MTGVGRPAAKGAQAGSLGRSRYPDAGEGEVRARHKRAMVVGGASEMAGISVQQQLEDVMGG